VVDRLEHEVVGVLLAVVFVRHRDPSLPRERAG
jgi:hypothetical protein